MLKFLGILIIVFILFSVFGDRISRWLRNYFAGRAEDTFRRMMGMPTRKEERQAAKRRGKQSYNTRGAEYTTGSQHTGRRNDEPIIPREYAEDVEFVEYKEFTSTEIKGSAHSSGKGKGANETCHESQVEEAEYIEIKQK